MFSTADLEKMSISDLKVTGFPPRGFGEFANLRQAIMERLAVKGAASDEKALADGPSASSVRVYSPCILYSYTDPYK